MITDEQISKEESYSNLIIDLYNETKLSAEVIESAAKRFGQLDWDATSVAERANAAIERLGAADITEMEQHIAAMSGDLMSARQTLIQYQELQEGTARIGMLRFMLEGAIKRSTRAIDLANRDLN